MMAALLVVEIVTVPSADEEPLVPPAMLRIRPMVMRSWTRRNCLTLNTGVLPLELIQSTLYHVSPILARVQGVLNERTVSRACPG